MPEWMNGVLYCEECQSNRVIIGSHSIGGSKSFTLECRHNVDYFDPWEESAVALVNASRREPGGPVRVHIETRGPRPPCPGCGGPVWVGEALVDDPARLVWHKRRWICPNDGCEVGSFTESAPYIAAARLAMTDRAGRWVTEQVGRRGRPVSDLAKELGCDWHTINDTVIAYGEALVDDPARIGRWRTQAWSTSIVDVGAGQLLDVIPGRSAAGACEWL